MHLFVLIMKDEHSMPFCDKNLEESIEQQENISGVHF